MGLEKCPKCGKESLIKTRSIINLKTYEKQNINFSRNSAYLLCLVSSCCFLRL